MSNPGSRYVRLLESTKGQNLNNGTVAGGLAHALTQGLRGYASRKADEEEQEKARQKQQAITDVLSGMNGGSLTSEGPTQEAAANARIQDPGRLAALIGDPSTAPFAMRIVEDAMKPAPERKMVQGVDGKMYYPDTGQPVLPGVQKPEEAYNLSPGQQRFVGNRLVASVPAEQKRYLTIPSIGVMDLQTNQIVTPATEAPTTGGGLNITPPPTVGRGLPPKVAGDVVKADATGALKELGAMREQMKPLNDMAEMATRFGNLLEKQDTGGFLRRIPGAGTLEGAFVPEIQEMQALTDRITPLMRAGMPGAASDTDVRMFRGATFGPDKDPEVNRNIITGMKSAAQNAQDRLAFMEAYVGQTNTLRGANEAWQDYLNANPIFDPNGNPSMPTLNANRQSWREYFTPKKTGQNAKPLSAAEREEYDRLRKELGQ